MITIYCLALTCREMRLSLLQQEHGTWAASYVEMTGGPRSTFI